MAKQIKSIPVLEGKVQTTAPYSDGIPSSKEADKFAEKMLNMEKKKVKKNKLYEMIDEKKLRKIVSKNALEQHMNFMHWMYKNYKPILREYEATLGNLRIEFVGEVK